MAEPPQPGAARVFLRDTSLRFEAEGVDVLRYSHAARLLLVIRRGSITAYSIDRPSQAPQGPRNAAVVVTYDRPISIEHKYDIVLY
ncbi:hypothetical protein COCSUDRAFT_57550 [Coccomyxa subellipsoidea C-169]|uniref:Uncharacterized protein n=1 Tax=Coccomyxa subellipsoidea (strain C-169) TaxID=574566 RepID=I0YPT3_COCSC|nr:hypothetical protein COCSUDRAFT_57550 [Coccomyxa subellipsoidea C-169]EIE20402.1 hypothetical protein COCSUDRAFT_57550 [Coccomyxa subellipsoidea C-169]|eukprot:XP_005644946.1 hypothetical protein COCSUDRAFT_57550 [Coccomyxa subellipsoidea C-169]